MFPLSFVFHPFLLIHWFTEFSSTRPNSSYSLSSEMCYKNIENKLFKTFWRFKYNQALTLHDSHRENNICIIFNELFFLIWLLTSVLQFFVLVNEVFCNFFWASTIFFYFTFLVFLKFLWGKQISCVAFLSYVVEFIQSNRILQDCPISSYNFLLEFELQQLDCFWLT
jgi:hypothetical protein